MFQATNPPTLKRKLAEDDVSFGSESTSECENVEKKRLRDEAEAGVDIDMDPSPSIKMFQATNPPTLKRKLAEYDVSFGSESTSECQNVKKERLGDEAKAGVDVDMDMDPSPSTPASSSNEECDNIFCKIYVRNFKHKKTTHSFYGGCPGCVLASRLCDCNNNKRIGLCCFIRATHTNMHSPANVVMEIIAKTKKSYESRLSTPCYCFRYDCCWLQTFPDDMKKIVISRRMFEEFLKEETYRMRSFSNAHM
jgi:hypothetical protein